MILGGTALLLSARRRIQTSRQAASQWLRTHGTVLTSSSRPLSFGSPINRDAKANSHALSFEYAYTVNGTRHVSDRPVFFSMHTWAEIEPFLEQYPEGSKVQVFYDPGDPSKAVIETEPRPRSGSHTFGMATIIIIAGAIQLVVGVLMWSG